MGRYGAIVGWVLFGIGAPASALSQQTATQVCVQDGTGRAIPDVTLTTPATAWKTGADGCATISGPFGNFQSLTASKSGFAALSVPVGVGSRVVTLQPVTVQTEIEVTTARVPLPLDASASSVRMLSAAQLGEAPGFTLDDRLREVAGFQLFRRTASWVANPTTQGTSLRGLGSTAASRTLVLSDQVPLNDAFGGWVHWNELPELAIRDVELVRGGASDLYGSSAIGGVIDEVPIQAENSHFALDLAGATEDTGSLNGLLTHRIGQWSALTATSLFRTDGYVLTAPAVRGPIDTPYNVHSQSGRLELRRSIGSDGDLFVNGNLLNEARQNGTPLQSNATRLWRYTAGADWTAGKAGRFVLRAFGNDQGYRQALSAIAANRASEQLTRLLRTPSEQVGGTAQWERSVRTLTLVAGADALDTRGSDDETPVTRGVLQTVSSTHARQRDIGGYGELLWQPLRQGRLLGGWSAALSGRVDRFRSFDAQVAGSPIPLPTTDETLFNPRLGVVKQVGAGVSLTASTFRAFRGPSLNELYRTGQVGQQTTLANPTLRSERATGFELGGLATRGRLGSLRASYFWTQVNRPVAALALVTTATAQTLMRDNLGQLESRGVTAEYQLRPLHWMELTGGYQFALSTVTSFAPQPTLVGKWTPQVPRHSATAQLRVERSRWGVLLLDGRQSGRQYDDTANAFELHSYFQLNAYAEHQLGERVSIYASGQNLFDRSIDAGRTPILTLGTPRVVLAGIRLR